MNRHVRPCYEHQKEIYIAKVHWNWKIVLDMTKDSVQHPWNTLLSREKYLQVLGYLHNEEEYDQNLIYFAPNMSLTQMEQELQALRVHKASSLPNIQEDTSLSRRDSAAVDKLVQSAKEKKKDEKYSRLRQMSSQRKYS